MNAITTVKERVVGAAKSDAATFVNEFGQAFSEETDGDWDAVAWGDSANGLRLTSEQKDTFWPIYQEAFISETQRLASILLGQVKDRAKADAAAFFEKYQDNINKELLDQWITDSWQIASRDMGVYLACSGYLFPRYHDAILDEIGL